VLVTLTAQGIAPHSRSGFLERPDVVNRLSLWIPVGILETNAAPLSGGRTLEAPPGVFDEFGHGLLGVLLLADSHDFDAFDGLPEVAGVVALAQAEPFQSFGREPLVNEIGATGELLEGACGPYLELRRRVDRGLAPHGLGAIGSVEEVEIQEYAFARGAVDVAALQSLPNGVTSSRLGVDGHKAACVVKRRSSLQG
jgi:hypothetical protein